MSKRGQATLLIILGIVIVSLVVLFFAFKDDLLQSDWETARSLSLSVPEEAEELHDYLGECVRETIEEPVLLAGQQGGYVEIPDDPIGDGEHNTFSNALEIFEGSDFETAYWFYVAANGVSQDQMPALELVEEQMESFVNSNLAECADDFEIFQEHNASVGEIRTEVEIEDEKVLFTVYYPVEIALDEFNFEFEAFYESVDVPLGKMYESAVEIMETENEEAVFEELTYDMMVLYDELPLSWSDFECDEETWSVEEVEDDLKEIIMQNFFAFKVRGTDYVLSEESDEDYFEFNMLDTPADDLSVNVWYLNSWPLSMQVYPAEDGEIVEDSLTGSGFGNMIKSFFCLNTYNVIYDLKYPVLVSLYDEESDYTFQFASMVVLDNNQPRENTEGLLSLQEVEEPICDDATTELTVSVEGVEDNGDFVELEDVDVTFQCITSNCDVGSTRGSKGDAELVTYVPPCVNGQVIASKEGYQESVETVTTLEDSEVRIIMEKFYNLTFDVDVVDLEGETRRATSDESLIIKLTEQSSGYSTSLFYPTDKETVLLVPGTYDVVGQLITESPFDIVIDGSSYEKCVSNPVFSLGGLFGLESDASCIDVDVSEVQLDSVVAGGLTMEWTPDRYELADASHVTFYVTSPGEPENEEELEDVLTYLELGIGNKGPEFT